GLAPLAPSPFVALASLGLAPLAPSPFVALASLELGGHCGLDVDGATERGRVDRHHEGARPPMQPPRFDEGGEPRLDLRRAQELDRHDRRREPALALAAQEVLDVAARALEVIAAASGAIALAVARIHRALEAVETAVEQLVGDPAAQRDRV